MKQYSQEAILLAVRDFGTADRMVTLLSKDYGKLKAIAYGARRTKSSLTGSVQPFTYVSASLFPGKGLDTLKQCEIKESFYYLTQDIVLMAYAGFIAEITDALLPEKEAHPDVFQLLLQALRIIKVRNPRITALAFAWKMLRYAGYAPQYQNCVVCGNSFEYPVHFSFSDGGVCCDKCRKNEDVLVQEATIVFLKQLINLDFEKPVSFTVSGASLMEMENLLVKYLLYYIEKPLKSLRFIQQVFTG